MRLGLCVVTLLAATPVFADSVAERPAGRGPVTEAEIRSGLIVDDGLDIPHIRPGTQYFEIHGSTRIARALGEFRLPTDDAGLLASDRLRPLATRDLAAW